MIRITPAAASEMRRLLSARGCSSWGLRVGVKGGGCSDLSYAMQFEEKPAEHDRIFEADGVRVYCDPKSYIYLNGLTLDYSAEVMDGGFKFVNPNARQPCACGSSTGA